MNGYNKSFFRNLLLLLILYSSHKQSLNIITAKIEFYYLLKKANKFLHLNTYSLDKGRVYSNDAYLAPRQR